MIFELNHPELEEGLRGLLGSKIKVPKFVITNKVPERTPKHPTLVVCAERELSATLSLRRQRELPVHHVRVTTDKSALQALSGWISMWN